MQRSHPPVSATPSADISARLTAIEVLNANAERRLPAIEAAQQATEERLHIIEKVLDASQKKSEMWPAVIAALAAVLGAVAGAAVSGWVTLSESKRRGKQEVGRSVIEWQLKQLSCLYGPMRALLEQSFALYRQMNQALASADSDHFRFQPAGPGGDPDQREFQIRKGPGPDDWTRFRTVLHISKAYGLGLGVDAYFDEIVAIARRIEKIIQESAGYARPEEEELMTVFGKYLAHVAVLKCLHQQMQKPIQEWPGADGRPLPEERDGSAGMVVDQEAVFPLRIRPLIYTGFAAITENIEKWRQRATE
jgi:hypothetical protein